MSHCVHYFPDPNPNTFNKACLLSHIYILIVVVILFLLCVCDARNMLGKCSSCTQTLTSKLKKKNLSLHHLAKSSITFCFGLFFSPFCPWKKSTEEHKIPLKRDKTVCFSYPHQYLNTARYIIVQLVPCLSASSFVLSVLLTY